MKWFKKFKAKYIIKIKNIIIQSKVDSIESAFLFCEKGLLHFAIAL